MAKEVRRGLVSGYSILEVEPTEFAKRSKRGCESEGGVKGNYTYSGLSNLNDGIACWVGRSSVLDTCITWLPVRYGVEMSSVQLHLQTLGSGRGPCEIHN